MADPSLTPSCEFFRDLILFNLNISLKAGFIGIDEVDIHLVVHLKTNSRDMDLQVHIDATL